MAELYDRASAWSEENGLTDEAISYALLAQDWARSIRLVERVATALWKEAKHGRISG